MRLWVTSLVVLGSAWAMHAHASPYTAYTAEFGPTVVVRADPSLTLVAFDKLVVQLRAGLATSGIDVRASESPNRRLLALVELEAQPADRATLRIRLNDRVTSKTLERSVDLASIPADSRAVAVAVYVEELLEASWAELALQKRVFLQQHPANAPAEVTRAVESDLPATVPAERPLRLSLGGIGSTFHGGATQFGPELSIGWRALPWLEPTLRLGYRVSTPTNAPDGTIEGQAVVAGAFIDLVWPITSIASAYFPQGVNVSRVTFVAHPDSNARVQAESGIRPAIFFSHGAGARLAINRVFSASAFARLCWTLLPAEAADNGRTVVGISGVGGEAGLAFDARF